MTSSTTGWTRGPTYNLFLRVLVGAEQVDSLHVSKVDVMAQKKDEEQLADILFLTVAVQSFVSYSHNHRIMDRKVCMTLNMSVV